MSSAFATMGLLVLAGFALGLVVGWLTWRSGASPVSDPESTPPRTQVQHRPMTQGLPDWQGRQLPAGEGGLAEPRSSSGRRSETADPTVVIGPRTFDTNNRAGRRPRRR